MAHSHARPDTASPTPALLQALQQEALRYAPAYQGAMSNHLPMALHAAWALGADEACLRALLAEQAGKLEAAPPPAPALPPEAALPQGWLQWRGQRAAYPELLLYFQHALAVAPATQVLTAHLSALLPGLHAFAFHGLIRTAHAWESCLAGSAAEGMGELAVALASWAAWFESLPVGCLPADNAARLPLSAWAARLRERSQGWRSELPMISWRMQAASQTGHYTDLAERLARAPSLAQRRDELMSFALDAYLHSRNFTLLHLITGLRALRVLLPLLPPGQDDDDGDDGAGRQDLLARAALAGWLAGRVQWTERPELPGPLHAAARSWPALRQAALAQPDEHVIKLVHACWQEDGLRPDPRWRQAAALALRLP